MTDHELEEALGICCGNTTAMRVHIHDTLRIFSLRDGENKDWDKSRDMLEEHLQLDRTETGPGDAMFTVYLHYLDKLDLIEHGSGIAGSWLTTHGKDVLRRLDDQPILDELKLHLENAKEWASLDNMIAIGDGFSCVSSVIAAVQAGRTGLALDRWDDLSSPKRPELSEAAQSWKK